MVPAGQRGATARFRNHLEAVLLGDSWVVIRTLQDAMFTLT